MNTKTTISRLSWAGVALEAEGKRLVIDAVEGRNGEVQGRIGQPRLPLLSIGERIDVAVVTHLHKDHFDLDALKRKMAPGAPLYVPAAAAPELESTGLRVIGVRDWERVQEGPFTLTPVPAVDGFGAHQSSWIVTTADVTIFHAGDSLFHGYWWQIAKFAPAIDVAFFPINGAIINIPGVEPTGLNGVMTAEQAVIAARLLKARVAVPIHYAEFNHPPIYNPDPHAESTFLRLADREKITARVIAAGERVAA
jgi:L-ascorbate metabolism protein UlaG (beta-lactamase superfamily)